MSRAMGAARLAVALAAAAGPAAAWAQGESQYQDGPAPDSVLDYNNPISDEFRERAEEVVEIEGEEPALDERPADRVVPEEEPALIPLPPLLEQGRLGVHVRSYYLRGKLRSNERREAWAYGGWVSYRTPWIAERLAFGTTLYTSQRIHAPGDRDGTRLLKPGPRSYTVFGQLHAKLRLKRGQELSLYRQEYSLPYVNRRDIRMTPNTFEGYTISGRLSRDGDYPKLGYIAGWISRIKELDSDRFVPMGETMSVGGDPKRGMSVFGAGFHANASASVGAVNYHVSDVGNIFYVLGDHTWSPSDDLAVRAKLHYTDQRSVGDDLWTGSSFDTWTAAGSAALSYRTVVLTLAASSTSREQRIRSPFGTPPTPLSLMLRDFDRAGEDAWLIGLSWDFGPRIGIDGLSGFANYARGNARHDAQLGTRLPDEEELDLTLDCRFQAGWLAGFWVRLRGALVREAGGDRDTQSEIRLIVNYEVPLGDAARRSAERRRARRARRAAN